MTSACFAQFQAESMTQPSSWISKSKQDHGGLMDHPQTLRCCRQGSLKAVWKAESSRNASPHWQNRINSIN